MGPVRRVVPEGSITAGLVARDSANNVLNRGCPYLQEAGSILFEFVMNAPRTYPNSVGCSMHCIYMQSVAVTVESVVFPKMMMMLIIIVGLGLSPPPHDY